MAEKFLFSINRNQTWIFLTFYTKIIHFNYLTLRLLEIIVI